MFRPFILSILLVFATTQTAAFDPQSLPNTLGARGDSILCALDTLQEDQRNAALFLLEHMPYSDLVRIDTDVLVEHTLLACEARRTFPWGSEISDDVFFTYVLPYRTSQEPIERWRRLFLDMLTPRLEGVTDVEQAAVIVNRAAGELIGFKQTQRRDQGPLETLASGYGRCEEMVIFFNAMLRSVCIPARKVWTPWWQHMDNNHAWTEVLTPNGWVYTGAAEPRDSLGTAWFDKSVEKVALVLCDPFGPPASDDEFITSRQGRTFVNSTASYLPVGYAEVMVTKKGEVVPDVAVALGTFNFGALRTLATIACDDNGRAFISIGPGTYVVSAGVNGEVGWTTAVVNTHDTTFVTIDLADPPSGPRTIRVGP
jgi:transglutaminase-like putative cysteine protease